MNIKEIIDDERIDLAMQLDMLSETELNIIDFALERIEDAVMKRIAELEGQVELWKTHHKTTCYEWTLEEQNVKDLEQHIAELEQVLRWLDTQGGLGYEKHAEIKKVLGVKGEHQRNI